MNWYSKVRADISYLPNCLEYYYAELDKAKAEVKIYGSVEKASAALPGVVEQRFNQLQEIESILEHLNIQLRKIKSKLFRQYLEKYNKILSSRDADRYVEGEVEVVDMEEIINEVALLRNNWLGIIKGLEIKGFQINNLIRLKVAGMEDFNV